MKNHIQWLNLTNEDVYAHVYRVTRYIKRSRYKTLCKAMGGKGKKYTPWFPKCDYSIRFYDKKNERLLAKYEYVCVKNQSFRVTLRQQEQEYSITIAPEKNTRKTRRPFYLIAHRCNNLKDIRNVIRKGANAIECDVRSNDNGETWFVNHDFATTVGTDTLQKWLKELSFVAADFKEKFALIYFDIKNPECIEKLHSYVNKYLQNNEENKIKILYSASSIENAENFKNVAEKLHPWEGMTIDYDDDPLSVQAFFKKIGINRCWYSNGINAVIPDSDAMQQTLKKAGELRDVGKIIKKTCIWTIEKKETIAEYIYNELVDGAIINAGGGDIPRDSIQDILEVVCASEIVRLAVRSDDAFAVFDK